MVEDKTIVRCANLSQWCFAGGNYQKAKLSTLIMRANAIHMEQFCVNGYNDCAHAH